jgi:inorganic pyrophosphatase
MSAEFWAFLQRLVDTSQIVIDQPKGSYHHRFTGHEYPVDYGYLEGTTSQDGAEVDIWIGSLGKRQVVGSLCTVDLLKKDTELKILLDCSNDEIEAILNFVNQDRMRGVAIIKGQEEETQYGMDT